VFTLSQAGQLLRAWFPDNTLRRLALKFLLRTCQHPFLVVRLVFSSAGLRFVRLFLQGEYSLLEETVDQVLQLYADLPLRPFSPDAEKLRQIRAAVKELPVRPEIRLAVSLTADTYDLLPQTLADLADQVYRPQLLFILYEPSLTSRCQEIRTMVQSARIPAILCEMSEWARVWRARGYVAFIRAGDRLAPQALAEMILAGSSDQPADLIYADEMQYLSGKEWRPVFKPAWSPELLLSTNYIGNFFLVAAVKMPADLPYGLTDEGMYDLLLKVTDHPLRVCRVAQILYASACRCSWNQDKGRKILSHALLRRGLAGEVQDLPYPRAYRARLSLSGTPKISIILLTAYRDPGMLIRCLESVFSRSTYKNIEVVLMQHQEPGAEVRRSLENWPLRMLRYQGQFNYSRMNNLAVAQTQGEYLLFLNDDTEVITPDWLEALLEHAVRPEVGVVGCWLRYADNATQHGGIFLVNQGTGARHAFRHVRQPGNSRQNWLGLVRNCAAVTFASAMVPRQVFNRLGGFDERLAVECNDVDFCLRASAAGYRIIYTPFAVLYHKELVTRRTTHFPADLQYYWRKWQTLTQAGDPFFHPLFSQDSDKMLPAVRCLGPGSRHCA